MKHQLVWLALIGIALCSALVGDDAPIEQVQATHTERMDFPSGGLLRMVKSTGDLTIEGWDRPDVEITTVKSTKSYHPSDRAAAAKSLDRIQLTTERKGDELTITTVFPKHPIPLRLVQGVSAFEMQYVVKVPANARLVIEHDSGNVHIDGITGDVRAKNGMGQITLHLAEQGQYAFDTKCDFGTVDTDFAGPERGKIVGRAFLTQAPAPGAQKLYARMGVGDITILKIRQPAPPASITP
jgi:hypothetical protein